VQDWRSTLDRARDRNRIEQVELRRRRSVDLVPVREERNRRSAEDDAPAGHQEAHAAPPTNSRIVMCAQAVGWPTAGAERNPKRHYGRDS
jgi:hypothetical protein